MEQKKFGRAKIGAVMTAEKSRIPVMAAATYPAITAIRIGITERKPRNRTEPNTAKPRVTKNTMAFRGSMTSSRRPALLAALPESSRPMRATTGAHGGGRKDDVDPFIPHFINDERQDTAGKPHGHEAAQGVFIAPVGNDDAGRSQKGEAGAQIGRSLSLGDQNEKQSAQAVHEKNDGRVDPEQEGDQH